MCIITFIGKYGCSKEVITCVLLHLQVNIVITSSEQPYLPVNEIIHML
jgi:hypothetical protein